MTQRASPLCLAACSVCGSSARRFRSAQHALMPTLLSAAAADVAVSCGSPQPAWAVLCQLGQSFIAFSLTAEWRCYRAGRAHYRRRHCRIEGARNHHFRSQRPHRTRASDRNVHVTQRLGSHQPLAPRRNARWQQPHALPGMPTELHLLGRQWPPPEACRRVRRHAGGIFYRCCSGCASAGRCSRHCPLALHGGADARVSCAAIAVVHALVLSCSPVLVLRLVCACGQPSLQRCDNIKSEGLPVHIQQAVKAPLAAFLSALSASAVDPCVLLALVDG